MGRKIALTEARKAALMADIAHGPTVATYHRFDMQWMVRKVGRAGSALSWLAHVIADLAIPAVVLFVLALQLPDVADAFSVSDEASNGKRTLVFYVSGNTPAGAEYMRDYLLAKGYAVTDSNADADRVLLIRKQVATPRACKDTTALRLTLEVQMPNGLTLQRFESRIRNRLLSCGSTAYMADLAVFIDSVLADQEFYLDQYFNQ